MSEEQGFTILIGFLAFMFFGLLGLMGYSDHAQRMACIEKRGTYYGSVCIFSEAGEGE